MKKRKTDSGFVWRKIFAGVLALILIAGGILGYSFYQNARVNYPWLPMYVQDLLRPNPAREYPGLKHILFLYVDHFEPHNPEEMKIWMDRYPKFADSFRDADGRRPQHSWFWYFSYSNDEEKKAFLRDLAQLSYEGYGEVELHMHHYNDNEESLTKLMTRALQLSYESGALVTAEETPRKTFGFIHGLWGLDNSRGRGACGVSNELILLRQLGAYADFTMPSWGPMHSKMVNRFYYAVDDPAQPKSYDAGEEAEAGKIGAGDLFMFTGQSIVRWDKLKPHYDNGEIDALHPPAPERIDRWIKKGFHLKGRPDWIFVKVYSHGALIQDYDQVLGKSREVMQRHLEKNYNDGQKYKLHYVTAREAYNIVKAAEAGKTGDPNDFRNYLIPPYVNRFLWASVPFETISMTKSQAAIRFLSPKDTKVTVRLRSNRVNVSGASVIESISQENESRVVLIPQTPGIVKFEYAFHE